MWQQSLPAQEAARYHRSDSGFGRAEAEAGTVSPHALLAVGLASAVAFLAGCRARNEPPTGDKKAAEPPAAGEGEGETEDARERVGA